MSTQSSSLILVILFINVASQKSFRPLAYAAHSSQTPMICNIYAAYGFVYVFQLVDDTPGFVLHAKFGQEKFLSSDHLRCFCLLTSPKRRIR